MIMDNEFMIIYSISNSLVLVHIQDDFVNDDLGFDDEEFGSEDDSFSGMGETDRKKRQRELTERFLALSATIPGFTKVGTKFF